MTATDKPDPWPRYASEAETMRAALDAGALRVGLDAGATIVRGTDVDGGSGPITDEALLGHVHDAQRAGRDLTLTVRAGGSWEAVSKQRQVPRVYIASDYDSCGSSLPLSDEDMTRLILDAMRSARQGGRTVTLTVQADGWEMTSE